MPMRNRHMDYDILPYISIKKSRNLSFEWICRNTRENPWIYRNKWPSNLEQNLEVLKLIYKINLVIKFFFYVLIIRINKI